MGFLTIAGAFLKTGPGRAVAIALAVALAFGLVYGLGKSSGKSGAELDAAKDNLKKVQDAETGKEKVARDVGNDSDRDLIERLRRDR